MVIEPEYDVVAPTGRMIRKRIPVNVRPASLADKTVGFVWDFLFKGPVLFDAVRRLLGTRFADVRFIDYDYFGDFHFGEKTILEGIPDKLVAAGIDVAVVGIGA